MQSFCQEKKEPPPPKTVVADSIKAKTSAIRETPLPTINLKEIVITGRSKVEVLESSKISINPENKFFKVSFSPLEGRIFRKPEPLKYGKKEKIVEVPISGKGNEAYFSFGRYVN
ncbi:hypothetical protein DRQ09_10190, partial [candidate division KSB1 bacterium]